DADDPTARIRPGNCSRSSGMSECLRRYKISKEIPGWRSTQCPAQAPRSMNPLVLVGNHGLHSRGAEDTLRAVAASAEKCHEEFCQVTHPAVHAAPRVSHIPPVRAVRPEPFGLVCVRIRSSPGLTRLFDPQASESQSAVRHIERVEDGSLHEVTQSHAGNIFHDSAGQKDTHALVAERSAG